MYSAWSVNDEMVEDLFVAAVAPPARKIKPMMKLDTIIPIDELASSRPAEENPNRIFLPPLFPGCSVFNDYEDQKTCSDARVLEAIYEEIIYPTFAQENGIQGTVILRFMIEENGSISNLQILRNQGGGLGSEACRALTAVYEKMGPWTPGTFNGRPIRVTMNLPVIFQLIVSN
ncbi:MAG: energy transducer TonB [Bacteroidota bacterium]